MNTITTCEINTEEIIAKANTGDADAQYIYGLLSLAGACGVAPDPAKAASLLEEAARKNVLYAMYHIGLMYSSGIGVNQDINAGLAWLKKAAEANLPEANTQLGIFHLREDVLGVDMDAARHFLERGQACDDALARYVLGNIIWEEYQKSAPPHNASPEEQCVAAFEAGLAGQDISSETANVPKSPFEVATEGRECGVAQAIAALKDVEPDLLKSFMGVEGHTAPQTEQEFKALWEAAERGDVAALHEVALYLLQSDDAENMSTGLQFLETAGKHGYSPSQVLLGALCASGELMDPDSETSMYWYTQAANNGNPDGELALGMLCLEQGDVSAGKRWLEKAAEQGNDDARFQLAQLLLDDTLPAKDEQQAIRLLRKAAKNGHADAMYVFGLCYAQGTYLPHDDALGFSWLRKAAQNDHSDAQFQLGNMYASGVGTEPNETMAKHWYRAAMRNGNIFAELALHKAITQMA